MKYIFLLFIIVFLLFLNDLFGQCNISTSTADKEARKITYQDMVGFLDEETLNAYDPANNQKWSKIGIAIHIVKGPDDSLGISDAEIDAEIIELNNGFFPANISFHEIYRGTIDDPDGVFNQTTLAEEEQLAADNNLADVVNIYYLNDLSLDGMALSTFSPEMQLWMNDCYNDISCYRNEQYILIQKDIGSSKHYLETMTHEMGHFFDLLHTYSEGLFGKHDPTDGLTTNDDGYQCGDLLPETPYWIKGMEDYKEYCDDPTHQGYIAARNYMGAHSGCRSEFLPQQIQRMRYTLFNRRSNYIKEYISLTNLYDQDNIGGNLQVVQGSKTENINSGGYIGLVKDVWADVKTLNERFSNLSVKHNNWNSEGLIHKLDFGFTVQEEERNHEAWFKDIYTGTITTKLISNNNQSGGQIEFHDPWYVSDENDTQPDKFLPFNAPYTASGKYNETGKGVFKNLYPEDPFHYSVRAKVTQNIEVHGSEEIPYYFQNWEHNANANPTQPNVIKPDPETGINYYETPVVFTGDNGSVTAVYKGHRASKESRATGYNGGRSLTQTDDGTLHLVYEDNYQIWYTSSSDNGTNWTKDICISTASGDFEHPSIASYGNDLHVVWTNPMIETNPAVFYTKYNGSWSTPEEITQVDLSAMYAEKGETLPVIAVYKENGTTYPVVIFRKLTESSHGTFAKTLISFRKVSGAWQDSVLIYDGANPSLCADSDNGKLGLAYQNYDDIYYCEYNSSGWSGWQNISGDGSDKNPSVALQNGTAHVVWEGVNNGNDAIFYRELTNGDRTASATPNAYAPGYGMGNPIVVSSPTTDYASNPNVGVASNGDVAFFYNKGGEIYKKKKMGSTWYLYDYNKTGKYPSMVENDVRRAVYTKYSSAPYLLKSLYTEPSSGGQWGPYPIIGPQNWDGHHTESALRFEFPIDSVQNGGELGYITLDVLNVSFVEDSLGMNQQLQSDTMLLANPLQPLEIDIRVRFLNVNNGFDDNTVLFKADFVENGQSTFLTDLRYHELPAAAGDSVERFFKLATIVNLSGHEGHLQLSLADVVPNMYIIQNEDAVPLSKPLVEEITRKVPEQYTLKQNFPNPFNPSTHITFELPKSDNVKLDIFNVKGERVTTLARGFLDEGRYEVVFDGSGLASGLYFYRLEAGNIVQTRRMLLIK